MSILTRDSLGAFLIFAKWILDEVCKDSPAEIHEWCSTELCNNFSYVRNEYRKCLAAKKLAPLVAGTEMNADPEDAMLGPSSPLELDFLQKKLKLRCQRGYNSSWTIYMRRNCEFYDRLYLVLPSLDINPFDSCAGYGGVDDSQEGYGTEPSHVCQDGVRVPEHLSYLDEVAGHTWRHKLDNYRNRP